MAPLAEGSPGPVGLDSAKPTLEGNIRECFEIAKKMGIEASQSEKDDSDNIVKTLAENLAKAIDTYVRSAKVDITTVESTIPQLTVQITPSGAGTTIPSSISKYTGIGTLK